MVGGTAVALLLGHRRSVDFDFITAEMFSPSLFYQDLARHKLNLVLIQESKDTLIVLINSIKFYFFQSKISLKTDNKLYEVPVARLIDIAAMKLLAISQRGAKGDFIDLYFILQEIPFQKIASSLYRLYGSSRQVISLFQRC